MYVWQLKCYPLIHNVLSPGVVTNGQAKVSIGDCNRCISGAQLRVTFFTAYVHCALNISARVPAKQVYGHKMRARQYSKE